MDVDVDVDDALMFTLVVGAATRISSVALTLTLTLALALKLGAFVVALCVFFFFYEDLVEGRRRGGHDVSSWTGPLPKDSHEAAKALLKQAPVMVSMDLRIIILIVLC